MIKTLLCLLLLFSALSELGAQNQYRRGYPEKNPAHLYTKFQHPPKGYGNVPFYWWNGDSLQKERLSAQLETLSKAPIEGFAVSYAHTDPRVDTSLARHGYGSSGNTEPGSPALFSDRWWEIWKWYASASAKYGLGVGLDDYTFAWPNNGYFPDKIRDLPEMKNYQGTLDLVSVEVKGGTLLDKALPAHFLTAVAWPGKIKLDGHINQGKLTWRAPHGKNYKVYIICTKTGYALHPEHGKKLVKAYFGEIEKRLSPAEFSNMNYFFQDELSSPIAMLSWSDSFQQEFRQRKGYDILPYLPALVDNIGPETPKIRLDYCDVLLDLAEEVYFRPIYNWHAGKGLIYGSDNYGRGKNPLAYVDYFRANSWYTAPGNDAPARGSSFLETKVSSSIAHLYNRPRTWLEAFHSMGWGSTGAWLTEQIDHHFIAGGNLVCMHGLYYSTHGGWWEWAPPDFHFRMPYWPHMVKWLEYTERMSYLLSQGKHVSDVAIMYPTESMQAYPDATPKATFDLALQLSEQGIDYDFMHYKPLRDAQTYQGNLIVNDQTYRVLILSDLSACHHSTLLKALAHYRNGGIVITTGKLPQATTLEGEHSAAVTRIVSELSAPEGRQNAKGGRAIYVAKDEVGKTIRQLITCDFIPSKGKGKVLHRKIGDHDVYMVTNVAKNDSCFFRAKGKVELWNAADGAKADFAILRRDSKGTYLKMEKESNQSYLVVFSPGEPQLRTETIEIRHTDTIPLAETWSIAYLPTMDNTWGDYRLPPSDEKIGPEAPLFSYRKGEADDGWHAASFTDSSWRKSIAGYGIQAEHAFVRSDTSFEDALSIVSQPAFKDWQPYEFSWQYGVWNNPGPQGFHGLKNRVSNGFFLLNQGGHEFYSTQVWVPKAGLYKLVIDGTQPDAFYLDGQKTPLTTSAVQLGGGWHSLLAGYKNTPKINYHRSSYDNDPRKRSMLVFVPHDEQVPEKAGMYAPIVSSSWAMSNHLYYSPYGSSTNRWQFRMPTVPGVKKVSLETMGTIAGCWIAGKKLGAMEIALVKQVGDKRYYTITLPKVHAHIETLSLAIEAAPGYQGAAILPVPVKFDCEEGQLPLGNWASQGSLRYYSGGLYYRTAIALPEQPAEQISLDLGGVIATCEVNVNGQPAGVLIGAPYTLDITSLVKPGVNTLEVLVYSTLANHYQTIPSFYQGSPDAGLLGPARIILQNSKN